MARWRRFAVGFGIGLVALGGLLVLLALTRLGRSTPATAPTASLTAATPLPQDQPVPTPEPLLPTRTPDAVRTPATTATSRSSEPSDEGAAASNLSPPDATVGPSVTQPATTTSPVTVVPAADRFRLGISLPYDVEHTTDLSLLKVGWTMDWDMHATAPLAGAERFAQTVRMKYGVLSETPEEIMATAAASPGSLWLIANEPDVRWQDNVEPVTFARLYHDAYAAIKAGDPTAIVAAGGIGQTTPLRLRYLDLALEAYQRAYGHALPADAWHIHNYMLREERDSWGLDIPPGLPDHTGALYEIEDSGNIELFQEQIGVFRRWMLERGYGGLPLIISEFGIAMPFDYGFPPQRIIEFLHATTAYMLTASDVTYGDPYDDYRLVQMWCWFSLSSREYPSGNLVDADTGEWTELGRAWLVMVGTE